MASVISENFVARASYLSDEKERQIDKLQWQFYELKKQCDKYFDDLDDVEDTCKQAKENMKTVWLVRHSQQAEENFPCVPISTACKLKLPEMASVVSESGWNSLPDDSFTNKLPRVKNFDVFHLTRDMWLNW